MIPKSNLYKGTSVSSIKTMEEVSKLLKKFGIYQKRLTQESPERTFFEFIIHKDKKTQLMIRINIPCLEKNKFRPEFDEERSFRYFYHYLKALLSAKESEMYSLEQIFMAHIVMELPSGQKVTLGEQLQATVDAGKLPYSMDGFSMIPKALPEPEKKKNILKLTEKQNEGSVKQ